MIDDIRRHLREEHSYDERDIAPTLRASDDELWKLHANFHGEKLTSTYAARLLREHGVAGS